MFNPLRVMDVSDPIAPKEMGTIDTLNYDSDKKSLSPLRVVDRSSRRMTNTEMNHFGKVAEIAAELKKQAGKYNESRYIINRRRK